MSHILVPSELWAQQTFHLKVSGIKGALNPKVFSVDSSAIHLEATRIQNKLRAKGYWLANLEELKYSDDTVELVFYAGRKFDYIAIRFKTDSIAKSSLRTLDEEKKIKKDLASVNRYVEDQLKLFEDNGYPFAQLKIDSAKIEGDVLNLVVDVEPGMLINYDTLNIEPDGLLKGSFLSNFLDLKIDKPYSEKAIQTISNRMEELSFVQLNDVRVSYQLKHAKVALDLKKVPSNYFDGILGMIPDQVNGGVQFTGELNLSLQNLFKSAKALEIHWEKLQPESQKLNASYLHPLLFGSPLDFSFAYDQLKQDTAFSNRSLTVGFEYRLKQRLKMKVHYENTLGNQLSSEFEDVGDFNIDAYGMGLKYIHLDSRLFPTDGYSSNFNMSIGQKEVTSVDAPPNSTQYNFTANFRFYKRVSAKSVFHFELSGGLLRNDNLFINDLYRLGGLQSIRGFNEGQFFAEQFALSRIEWRILLDEQSFLLAFYDQSFMGYDISNTTSYSDRPAGIGVGMQMATKGGNFQILYGLGKTEEESFSFDSSKIHFGYRALF